MRRVIFTGGGVKHLPNKLKFDELKAAANIEHGEICRNVEGKKCHMIVEENGHAMGLPINVEATRIYNEMVGWDTGHTIVGHVVIVPKSDRIV